MINLTTSDITTLGLLIGVLFASYLILRSVVFPIIKRGASKTTTYIDDLFLDKKFLNRVSYVFVFVFYNFLIATPQFNLDIFNTEISTRISSSLLTLFVGLTIYIHNYFCNNNWSTSQLLYQWPRCFDSCVVISFSRYHLVFYSFGSNWSK